MTAVVGILNKTAVALAADSAVTVMGPNGKKIYNTANKIFKLSKYHPVGIAIFDSADLLTTPWEIIIKSYREGLENKSFPTLLDYRNDFLAYLKSSPQYVSDFAKQISIKRVLIELFRSFNPKNKLTLSTFDLTNFILHVEKRIEGWKINKGYVVNPIEENNIRDFIAGFDIPKFTMGLIGLNDDKLSELLSRALLGYFGSNNFEFQKSGLVFSGYGEEEIFPSINSIIVGEVIGENIRWSEDQSDQITDENSGSIIPFAQTDVMETLITGISPTMANVYRSTINQVLTNFVNTISAFPIGEAAAIQNLQDHLSKLDLSIFTNQFEDNIEQATFRYSVEPTINTVAFLSKEDLSDLAETLIYMTYMKRRIMSHEESVGGPIDVAIISKTDGFIWMKRKYYFKNDLNPHFFHIYYKKGNFDH